MKLKFATKTFIVSNVIFILFRSLQIILLTESTTAFLKRNFIVLNIIGTVICFLVLIYTALNSFLAIRQPKEINNIGLPTAILTVVSGLLLCINGGLMIVNQGIAWKTLLLLTLFSALGMFLFAASSILDYKFPKIAPIGFIALFLFEFLISYTYYSEHPLRIGAVYTILAICVSLLFYLAFGKIVSGVSKTKSFRYMYPLGLTASTFCFVATVPEIIAKILGFSENISPAYNNLWLLLGNGIFIATVTLNTFKKSNTFRN